MVTGRIASRRVRGLGGLGRGHLLLLLLLLLYRGL